MTELQKISEITGVSELDIIGKSRKSEIVEARQMLYCFLFYEEGMKLSEIGRKLNRTSATIIHGIGKMKGLCQIGDRRTLELIRKVREASNDINKYN